MDKIITFQTIIHSIDKLQSLAI